ncbi:MAG TPA: SitI3 family protein [Pseudonocardiaceae bacterium]|jgi:hypothetical protein|nr:SitI3 family protein [Pseudonocardiaceae bacterium]
MAISYSLDLATPAPAPQVAREVHDVARTSGLFDAAVTAEQLLDGGAVTTLGTRVVVLESRPQPWNPVTTDLGFTPTVSVEFVLDKDNALPAQQDDIVRIVGGLLDLVSGDLVLHREFEDIWLLRRGGELSVGEQDDLWPAGRLALLHQPYRRTTQAFADE